MIAPSQPMNSCRPPSSRDALVAGLDEQVEGVAQHHVVAERGDLARLERLHGGGGGQRHERGRAHVAVGGMQHARAGGAVAGLDREAGLLTGALLRSSDSPVISGGSALPAASARRRDVGQRPRRRARPPPSAVTITRHRVQRVLRCSGCRRRSSMWSALPWSAVIDAGAAAARAPPRRPGPGSASTVSIAFTAAGITPVWPTMSGLAKLMIPKRIVARVPVLDEGVRGRLGAHLGLVVVGRHVARGVDQAALLALVRVLLAAVEEVGHVRVLLGLGHVQLAKPRSASTEASVTAGAPAGRPPGKSQSSWYSVSVASVTCGRRRGRTRRSPPRPARGSSAARDRAGS